MTIFLHSIGDLPRKFDRLRLALMYASDNKVTGYIVEHFEGTTSIINLKKGKREGMKKGTWVSIK